MKNIETVLINTAELARALGMSVSWVRRERFNRQHGLPHALSIDGKKLGASVRYRWDDVLDWISNNNEGSAWDR